MHVYKLQTPLDGLYYKAISIHSGLNNHNFFLPRHAHAQLGQIFVSPVCDTVFRNDTHPSVNVGIVFSSGNIVATSAEAKAG